MTTPANLNTPDRLLRQALRDAGRLQFGDDPPAEVVSDCLSRLGDIINTWQTQGIKLWLNSVLSVTLTAGTATYSLGPAGSIISTKPTRVLEGYYVTTTGSRRPLTGPLSWNDYSTLGQQTQSGAVNSFFVDKQRANTVVKLWPVPDTTAASGGAVELIIQQQAVAPQALNETVSFPIEWFLALRWALADELASGQPPIIMDRCERKAAQYREMLENWDVEDAPTRFTIDSAAAGLQPSRFR